MSIRIAIAQCAPALGAVKRNLDMHEKWIARARAAGARLVIFPELSLTGYYLKDLAADVACAVDDPQLAPIAEAYDCTGVELSGNDLAETVAVMVRKGFDLKLAVPMALTVHRCRTSASGVFGKPQLYRTRFLGHARGISG